LKPLPSSDPLSDYRQQTDFMGTGKRVKRESTLVESDASMDEGAMEPPMTRRKFDDRTHDRQGFVSSSVNAKPDDTSKAFQEPLSPVKTLSRVSSSPVAQMQTRSRSTARKK
jgi:hypothetical protein